MKKHVLFLVALVSPFPLLFAGDPIKDDGSTFARVWIDGHRAPRVNSALYDPNLTEAERLKEYDLELARYRNGERHLEMAKIKVFFEEMVKPQNVAYAGATALLLFGAWHATGLVRDVAYHHLMIPTLAQKTSIRSWTSKIKGFFLRTEDSDGVAPRTEVKLSDSLIEKAAVLTHSIINAVKNDTFLRHYLFYGPPGTGKTMLATAMAVEAGMEYIYFSAGKLKQYSTKEAVRQLAHLFEYAKSYPKKVMIIIDEADDLFAHRDVCSEKTRTLLNLVLTYMGTEQSDYMVIALTNRKDDFDEAALSRFGEQVKIDPPGFKERRSMFIQYIQKYFVEAHTVTRDRRSFFQSLFTSAPKERTPLGIEPDIFQTSFFDSLAQKSEGLVGRDISDLLIGVQNEAYGRPDLTITQELILKALNDKQDQRAASLSKETEFPAKEV